MKLFGVTVAGDISFVEVAAKLNFDSPKASAGGIKMLIIKILFENGKKSAQV